jgi:hypothetical protein
MSIRSCRRGRSTGNRLGAKLHDENEQEHRIDRARDEKHHPEAAWEGGDDLAREQTAQERAKAAGHDRVDRLGAGPPVVRGPVVDENLAAG